MYHLIVINPRVEQGIDKGHDNTEDEHTLVVEHLLHLLAPHVGGILQSVVYIMEYRHNGALRF